MEWARGTRKKVHEKNPWLKWKKKKNESTEHGKKSHQHWYTSTQYQQVHGGFAWNLWPLMQKWMKKNTWNKCANIQNDNNWLELMSINRICNGEPNTKDYSFLFSFALPTDWEAPNALQTNGINIANHLCTKCLQAFLPPITSTFPSQQVVSLSLFQREKERPASFNENNL